MLFITKQIFATLCREKTIKHIYRQNIDTLLVSITTRSIPAIFQQDNHETLRQGGCHAEKVDFPFSLYHISKGWEAPVRSPVRMVSNKSDTKTQPSDPRRKETRS